MESDRYQRAMYKLEPEWRRRVRKPRKGPGEAKILRKMCKWLLGLNGREEPESLAKVQTVKLYDIFLECAAERLLHEEDPRQWKALRRIERIKFCRAAAAAEGV